MVTSKKNKPKKLDNCRRTKKSPPRSVICHQTVDEPQASGRNVQLGTVSHLSAIPTTSPPPNATVVVCVLASTGRADLWVRNNRGQTPLDLCPADQPLRRALIKCCNAAARARNVDAVPGVEHAINLASPYETYTQFITNDQEPLKECSKMLTKSRDSEFFDPEISFVDNSTASNWSPPRGRRDDIESSQNQLAERSASKIEATSVSATANLDKSLQKHVINEAYLMRNNTSHLIADNSKKNNNRYGTSCELVIFFIHNVCISTLVVNCCHNLF